MRTSVLAAITTALAVVIAGCTSPETSTAAPTPADPPFAQEVEQALQEAIDAQASAEQIADIEEIQATENVSYELTKAAAQRTVDCVVDAGGEGRQFDHVHPGNYIRPGYEIGIDSHDPEVVDRVLDGCDIREFFWVNYLYQIQPSLADERARSDEIRNQATADCLRGLGHDLPEDATWADILPVLQGLDLSAQEKCRGAAY